MIVDVQTNSKALNPHILDYNVLYYVEPSDPTNQILVLLHGLLTFIIRKDGRFQTSIVDFFIFRNFLKTTNFSVSVNLTDKAMGILKEFLEYKARLVDIDKGAFNSEIRTTMKSSPYEDQKAAIRLFLELRRSLNCSCVGLGKTLAALGTFNVAKNENLASKALVITLNQVKLEWNRELPKHTDYSYKIIGNGTDVVLDQLSQFKEDILVMHYDTLINDLVKAKLCGMPFDFWIVDEAHTMRNVESQRSQAVYELFNAMHPAYLNLLTGTPVSNSPENAYSLLRFLAPNLLPSNAKFRSHFCNYILIKPKKNSHKRIPILSKEEPYKKLDQLQVMMELCSFRRTQDDVEDFPPTMITLKEIEMDADQKKLYDGIADTTYAEIAKMPDKTLNLQVIPVKTLRLRQSLSHPAILGEYKIKSIKFEVLDSMLSEILDDDPKAKVVLFSCFRDTLNLLVHKYKDKYGAALFAGTTDGLTEAGRKENNEKFFSDPSRRILCAMTSLGVGGNWGEVARTGIFIDLPIIPIDWIQSMGRITRRSAKGTSSIIILLCANSFDEWTWSNLDKKQKVSNEIVKADENIFVSSEELLKGLKK